MTLSTQAKLSGGILKRNSNMFTYLFLFYIFWNLNEVSCYPDGAPERACFVMIPRHRHPVTNRPVLAQKNVAPYNITVSRGTFNPDVPISVTISGAPFKGFLLVAVEDGMKDWTTGIFHSNDKRVKMNYCQYKNDAATHADNKWKTSVTVDWYAPATSAADFIQFMATVVTNRTIYWLDIKSSMIQPDPNMGEAQEGGFMAGGGGGGAGAGLDAWGYPTTPGYSMFGSGGRNNRFSNPLMAMFSSQFGSSFGRNNYRMSTPASKWGSSTASYWDKKKSAGKARGRQNQTTPPPEGETTTVATNFGRKSGSNPRQGRNFGEAQMSTTASSMDFGRPGRRTGNERGNTWGNAASNWFMNWAPSRQGNTGRNMFQSFWKK